MNKEIKAQWVAELRSGNHKQGADYLNIHGHKCCLGVLAEMYCKANQVKIDEPNDLGVIYYDNETTQPSKRTKEWAGLEDTNPNIGATNCMRANDIEKLTFPEIADLIEQYL